MTSAQAKSAKKWQKAAKICRISQKISPKFSKNFQKFVNFAKISQKIIFIYYRLGAL